MPKQRKRAFASMPKKDQIQLQAWAHEGTKESIQKIKAYMRKTKDEDSRQYARMALDEAEFFYGNRNK